MDAPCLDSQTTVEQLKAMLKDFNEARDWQRFHRPKELAIALSVEAAELLELFLWVDPALEGSRSLPEQSRLEAEVADVAICLLNVCQVSGIDLSAAITGKLEHNARKYPVSRAHGSAAKYTEYAGEDSKRASDGRGSSGHSPVSG